MNSLAIKYSEQNYLTREQVLGENEHLVGELIWQEVLNYRSIFTFNYTLNNHNYILVRCHLFNSLLLNLNDSIIYASNNLSPNVIDKDSTYFNNLRANKKLYINKLNIMLIDTANYYNINLTTKFINLINKETIFIKLILINLNYNPTDSNILRKVIYIYYNIENIYDNIIDTIINPYNDLTYSVLELIKNNILYLSELVIKLKCNKNSKDDLSDLILKYPQISSNSLKFYYYHNKYNAYYTINDYVLYNNSSYETARQGLEVLTKYNFYNKEKIGKRYVYYIG
ncbi:MAG: hypothetical protein RR646_05730 [Erysipelotrichaceae bacterium]